jgi:hypothetical protein
MTALPYKQGYAHEWLLGNKNVSDKNLEWVLLATPRKLSEEHDWVQWAFPTDEPSRFNPFAPVLTKDEVVEISGDYEAMGNYLQLVDKFLDYLEETRAEWATTQRHDNHLRISRAMKSCILLGVPNCARRIYEYAGAAMVVPSASPVYWNAILCESLVC